MSRSVWRDFAAAPTVHWVTVDTIVRGAVSASEDEQIMRVDLLVDGGLRAVDIVPPYEWKRDTTREINGAAPAPIARRGHRGTHDRFGIPHGDRGQRQGHDCAAFAWRSRAGVDTGAVLHPLGGWSRQGGVQGLSRRDDAGNYWVDRPAHGYSATLTPFASITSSMMRCHDAVLVARP